MVFYIGVFGYQMMLFIPWPGASNRIIRHRKKRGTYKRVRNTPIYKQTPISLTNNCLSDIRFDRAFDI